MDPRTKPSPARAVLLAASAGLAVVLAMALLLTSVTTDLRWALVVGVGTCWLGARALRGRRVPALLVVAAVAGPLCLAFHGLVVSEVPTVWFFLPAFGVAAAVGALSGARLRRVAGPLLGLATGFTAVAVVPGAVEASLFERVDQPAPPLVLTDAAAGTPVDASTLAGKVVLLDFFGTWCGPCIAALPEIERVHAAFADDPRVAFAAVCTNALDDTAADAVAFGQRYGLPYPVWFDAAGATHAAFGFTGVPSLVLLDTAGHVRLRHEGYNPSEDLAGSLERAIRELLDTAPANERR